MGKKRFKEKLELKSGLEKIFLADLVIPTRFATMNEPITYIDLFAGAGGLSEGFHRAGYEDIAHVEMDPKACDTLLTRQAYHILAELGPKYKRIYTDYLKGKITKEELYDLTPNFEKGKVINAAISKATVDEIFNKIESLLKGRQVDLIIGGPPCQAYSLAGRSRVGKEAMEIDPRASLYLEYAKFLERFKPSIFVFENVAGLLSFKNGSMLETMREEFKRVGYTIDFQPWIASDYGVLQERKRLIIIGWKTGLPISYPQMPAKKIKQHTISDILMDLPSIKSGEGVIKNGVYSEVESVTSKQYLKNSLIKNTNGVLTWHIARPQSQQDVEIYKWYIEKSKPNVPRPSYKELPARLRTHKNLDSFNDRFKVVLGEYHASQTVVAHICKDGHYYIHPDIQQARSLTVREAARLQSFPDDYFFEGARTAAFKQIGNAVPPLLAQEIAKTIKPLFHKSKLEKNNQPTTKGNLLYTTIGKNI